MFFDISLSPLPTGCSPRRCAPCGPAVYRFGRPKPRVTCTPVSGGPGGVPRPRQARSRCVVSPRPWRTPCASPQPIRQMIGYPPDCFRQKTDPESAPQAQARRGARSRQRAENPRSSGSRRRNTAVGGVFAPACLRRQINTRSAGFDRSGQSVSWPAGSTGPRRLPKTRGRQHMSRAVRRGSGLAPDRHGAYSLPGRSPRMRAMCTLNPPGARLATIRPLRGQRSGWLPHPDLVSNRQLHPSASSPWRHLYRLCCNVADARSRPRGERTQIEAGVTTGMRPEGCVPGVVLRPSGLNFPL